MRTLTLNASQAKTIPIFRKLKTLIPEDFQAAIIKPAREDRENEVRVGELDTVGVYFTKNFAMNTVTLVLQGGHLTLTGTLNRTQGWKTSAIADSSDIA